MPRSNRAIRAARGGVTPPAGSPGPARRPAVVERPRSSRLLLAGAGSLLLLLGLVGALVMFNYPYLRAGATSAAPKDLSPEESAPPGEGFASDRAGPKTVAVAFDAKRALGYLDVVCRIGPRISGTEGMTKQQELLTKHFEGLGGKVRLQKFTARQRSQGRNVEMANLIVSWHPDRQRRVILCSHYDTRPIADQEPNRNDWTKAFVSANDGGSGVALLMELAHHMKDLPTEVGVDFVFFDGEEYVFDRDDEYFFGSKHFAAEYRRAKGPTKYTAAVLLDMVGGKNARFPIEQNSWWKANGLVREVWGIAGELGVRNFVADEFSEFPVEDDHIALNRGGIPAIDIIDFKYPHWHRLTDTPDKCSGESLENVARVLAVWLQRTK
jgi:glutaminyl-peptide cyclotransferase